tara:strand:+ start:380 stop:553 length:174 start_codon:yes stop_codon:yes gene_type:complete
MDGVILIAIMVPAVMALFSMFLHLVNNTGGTKGITQPYTTKSGTTHTARKDREHHIV